MMWRHHGYAVASPIRSLILSAKESKSEQTREYHSLFHDAMDFTNGNKILRVRRSTRVSRQPSPWGHLAIHQSSETEQETRETQNNR